MKTLLDTFLNEPAVQALGWALLHFIWQGALLAALFAAANALSRRPQVRYAIGCALLLLMPMSFVATIFRATPAKTYASSPQASGTVSLVFPPLENVVSTAGDAIVIPTRVTSSSSLIVTLPGWAFCLWLIGVIGFSCNAAAGWLRVQRLRRRGTDLASQKWIETLEDLMQRLEVSGPVRLYTSAIAEVPTVIGWIRPYILLPVSTLTGLSESQLVAILAHELAHIRRHDYLVNLLQNAVETLLFYHPAVWWVSRRIREERELCCDDLAVQACGDVMLYATALTQLEELRGVVSEPAVAATGGNLLTRVQRLMGQRDSRTPARTAGSIAALTVAALVVIAPICIRHTPAIHAQSPQAITAQPPPVAPIIPAETAPSHPSPVPKATPTPAVRLEFEVASVRPATPLPSSGAGRGRGGGPADGPVRCGAQRLKFDQDLITFQCVDLRGLIQFAFGIVHPNLLSGPPWLMSQRFDIEAKLPTGATKAQLPEMFRSLLEDRFKLAIHRAPQEQPVEAIVVDKAGLRLDAGSNAGSPDSVLPDPDAPSCPPQLQTCAPSIRNIGGEPTAVTPLAPGIERYSSPSVGTAVMTQPHPARPGDQRTRIEAPDTTIRGLASLMQTLSFQPVVDMTGLSGRYSITLEWSVDRRALINQALAESPAAQAAQAAGPISGPNPAIDAAFEKADSDMNAAYRKALQNALLKLGLRLEQREAPIDTLIVDHVEKLPTDN